MNDDELAAIGIAAQLLLAPVEPTAPVDGAALWRVAGRTPQSDPDRARRIARARSRWSMRGRVRD
jgi:hypothetical protein